MKRFNVGATVKHIFYGTTWGPIVVGAGGTVMLASSIVWIANWERWNGTLTDEEVAQVYVHERLKLKRYTREEWVKLLVQQYGHRDHQEQGQRKGQQEAVRMGPMVDERQAVANIEKSLSSDEIQRLQVESLRRAYDRIDREYKENV